MTNRTQGSLYALTNAKIVCLCNEHKQDNPCHIHVDISKVT